MPEINITQFRGLSKTDRVTSPTELSFGEFKNVRIIQGGFIESITNNNVVQEQAAEFTEFFIDQNDNVTLIGDSFLSSDEDKPQVVPLLDDQYLFNYRGETLSRDAIIIDNQSPRQTAEVALDETQFSNHVNSQSFYWLDNPNPSSLNKNIDLNGELLTARVVSTSGTAGDETRKIILARYRNGALINQTFVTENIGSAVVSPDGVGLGNPIVDNNDIFIFCRGTNAAFKDVTILKVNYTNAALIVARSTIFSPVPTGNVTFVIDDNDGRLLANYDGNSYEINKDTLVISGTTTTAATTPRSPLDPMFMFGTSPLTVIDSPNRQNLNIISTSGSLNQADTVDIAPVFMAIAFELQDGSFTPLLNLEIGFLPDMPTTAQLANMFMRVYLNKYVVEALEFSNSFFSTISSFNHTTNELTMAAAHGFTVGDEIVIYQGLDVPGEKGTVLTTPSTTVFTTDIDILSTLVTSGAYVAKLVRERTFDDIKTIHLYASEDDIPTNFFLLNSLELAGREDDDFVDIYYNTLSNANYAAQSGLTIDSKLSSGLEYRFIDKINNRTGATHLNTANSTIDKLSTLFQYNDTLPQQLNPASPSINMKNIKLATGMISLDRFFLITDPQNAVMVFDLEERTFLNAGTLNYNALASLGPTAFYLRNDGFYAINFNELQKISTNVFFDNVFDLNETAFKGISGAIDPVENVYIFHISNDIYGYDLNNGTFFEIDINSSYNIRRLRTYFNKVYGLVDSGSGDRYKIYRFMRAGTNPDTTMWSFETNYFRFSDLRHTGFRYLEFEYNAEDNFDVEVTATLENVDYSIQTTTVSGSDFTEHKKARVYVVGAVGDQFKFKFSGDNQFRLRGMRYGR